MSKYTVGDALNNVLARAEEIAAANQRRTQRDDYTLGDALNDVLVKSNEQHQRWLQSQVKLDRDMLFDNLKWAVQEDRMVEAVKTIRHITGCSLDAAEDVWFAFTTQSKAAGHHHHLKDDAADYDAAFPITSKSKEG